MKALPACALLSIVLAAQPTTAAPLTPLERQHLVAHFDMTERWLVDEVSGLSSAQLQFRPAPGRWTIIEVLDHLTVAEPIYWQDFQKAMKAPASIHPSTSTDEGMLWYGIDRTYRDQAVPAETPKGQLHDVRAGLDILRKLHAQILQYVRTTNDELRRHIVERQQSDAYQWLLLISTHEQRHVLQIREVKADPRFPGSNAGQAQPDRAPSPPASLANPDSCETCEPWKLRMAREP
jgi:hypothetical protein